MFYKGVFFIGGSYMIEELVLFLLCFFLVLLVYEIFIVRKAKKKKDKRPMEVKYLITRYHLNMRKVDYPQLLQIVALVSSFDISFIVSVVLILDSYLWQILAALILVLPVILVSYHFVGMFYKKKGMTKDV